MLVLILIVMASWALCQMLGLTGVLLLLGVIIGCYVVKLALEIAIALVSGFWDVAKSLITGKPIS